MLRPKAAALRGHQALKTLQTEKPPARWLALVACDTPFFPTDPVARLQGEAVRADAQIAIPESGSRLHPVFALVRTDADTSRASLQNLGPRKTESWLARHAHVRVPFSSDPIDPFFNLNTPEDLAAAEAFLRKAEKG